MGVNVALTYLAWTGPLKWIITQESVETRKQRSRRHEDQILILPKSPSWSFSTQNETLHLSLGYLKPLNNFVPIKQLSHWRAFQSLSCFISPLYKERSHLCEGLVCDVWLGPGAPLLTRPGCPPQIRARVCINCACVCVCLRLCIWDASFSAVCVIHVVWPVCDAWQLTAYDTYIHTHNAYPELCACLIYSVWGDTLPGSVLSGLRDLRVHPAFAAAWLSASLSKIQTEGAAWLKLVPV